MSVYTGLGALNWLPDVERWARTMPALLETGGRLYLAEFHPFTDVFGQQELSLANSYFDRGPKRYDEPGTHADLSAPTVNNRSVEWEHTMGDVVSAIAGAGLRIELLHSTTTPCFKGDRCSSAGEGGSYRLREGTPALPQMYSLRARSAS